MNIEFSNEDILFKEKVKNFISKNLSNNLKNKIANGEDITNYMWIYHQ